MRRRTSAFGISLTSVPVRRATRVRPDRPRVNRLWCRGHSHFSASVSRLAGCPPTILPVSSPLPDPTVSMCRIPTTTLILVPQWSDVTSGSPSQSRRVHTMTNVRLHPRLARSRLATSRVFGESRSSHRVARPARTRWPCGYPTSLSVPLSGDVRTHLPG